MNEKAQRLQSAYGEILKRNLAATQKDIAAKMGASPSNVSSAFNGDPRVLTDRFLQRFNTAFGDIFSMNWLLTGEGEMLKPGSVQQTSYGDHSPNVNGDGNSVNATDSELLLRAFDEIAAQRKMTERAQEMTEKAQAQIDDLISIIKSKL